jgi:tetratricopeptide (TPR) repeat protein
VNAANTIKSITVALMLTCLLDPHAVALAGEDQAHPQPVRDPRYGLALFDFYQDHYFDAITDIMVAQQRKPISEQGADPDLLLGSLYLSYGMNYAATAIFQRLLDSTIPSPSHDLAWFYLGKLRYGNDQFDEAFTAFAKVGRTLPPNREEERLYLMLNAQLHGNRFDGAIKALDEFQHHGIWDEYARYNLGTALIRANRIKEGVILLSQVGQLESHDEEEDALRDKANMVIGYVALKDRNLTDPAAAFSRVRLNGPYSNQALLGMGCPGSNRVGGRRTWPPKKHW